MTGTTGAAPLRLITHGVLIIVVAALLVGCGGNVARDTTAADLMPNLGDYNVTNTLDIQDTVAKALAAASLGAGQVQITAMVAAISGLVACYQKAGAIEGRVYVKKAEPWVSGIVVIVNRNKTLDPATFFGCMGGQTNAPIVAQPCANAYSLPKGDNEFYVAYLGTQQEFCTAVCNSLEGCPK